MPELPEVTTTVLSLKKVLPGITIREVWSNYSLAIYKEKVHLKSPSHYENFKTIVKGSKVVNVRRRGKNILIDLNNKHTILVHMKMTGHFLLGHYELRGKTWHSLDGGIFDDPFNQHIRMLFNLSNGKQLAFSDLRKFAKVLVAPTSEIDTVGNLAKIGPEPLEKAFTFKIFQSRLALRPHWKVKQALLDQSLIAGIGNIYSDEILWAAGVHPFTSVEKIPLPKLKLMFAAIKKILPYAISLGGDSTSDFRRLDGTRGGFQGKHHAYHKTGKPCDKKDGGIIRRLKMGGRSAHYCDVHQELLS